MESETARICALGRIAAIVAVVLLVGVVAAGVSIPADGATDRNAGSRRRQRQASERVRSGGGERGHVRRRNNVIDKKSHVEKKPGWRKIE